MKITGTVHKFGDDINTDVIIPARYLNTSDPQELASHCMEDIDSQFTKKAKKGDVIVGGRNFGCGSSREHAPLTIKYAGISCVVAASFARIFYRNSINIGLPILECPPAAEAIENGHTVAIDFKKGEIHDLDTGKSFTAAAFPPFISDIIARGGLLK